MKKEMIVVEQDLIAGMAEGFLKYLEENSQDQNEQAIQDELDSILGDLFPDENTKARAAQIFVEAVNNKTTKLQKNIAKLVSRYFAVMEEIDVVEALTDRIADLEAQIACCEEESLQLANQHVAQLSESYNLNEATVEALWTQSSSYSDLEFRCRQLAKTKKPMRRSVVEETMETLNESDFFSIGGEEYIDPQMRKYLKAL